MHQHNQLSSPPSSSCSVLCPLPRPPQIQATKEELPISASLRFIFCLYLATYIHLRPSPPLLLPCSFHKMSTPAQWATSGGEHLISVCSPGFRPSTSTVSVTTTTTAILEDSSDSLLTSLEACSGPFCVLPGCSFSLFRKQPLSRPHRQAKLRVVYLLLWK